MSGIPASVSAVATVTGAISTFIVGGPVGVKHTAGVGADTSCDRAIGQQNGRAAGRAQRLAGRLLASLDYGQVDEILNDNLQGYLEAIVRQANQINVAIHKQYVQYTVDQVMSA